MTTQKIIRELNSDTKILIACFLLRDNKVSVNDLTLCTEEKTRTNISKQINEMRKAGVVVVENVGRNSFYSFNPELSEEIMTLIKTIVNTYHIVDEGREEFIPYK